MGDAAIQFILFACLFLFIVTFLNLSFILHKLRFVMVGCIYFGIGLSLHYYNNLSAEIPSVSSKTFVFKITKKLNSTEKYKKYEAVAQVENDKVNVIVLIPDKKKELDFIHYYKTDGFLKKVQPPEHDFQFDYANYLKRKNIEYQYYVNGEIISSENRNDLTFHEKLAQKRYEALSKIDKVGMSAQSREFLKGIILADRTEMNTLMVQDFNRSGLMHFLAISGTHMVVIFGLIYFFLANIFPLRFRKWAIILSIGFIWIFGGFVGFENSILRSCIMLTVYYIYKLLQRKPDLLHSLALSAFIILIVNTQQIFDVGFQLSFIAVLGIFWFNDSILKLLPKADNYLKRLIFNTISMSLAAQLATLPIIIYYFHQFSLISIFANIFIVPFSEAVIIFSFFLAVLIIAGLNFAFIDVIYDFTIQFLLKIIHWFAGFENLFFDNISMNLIEMLFLFIVLYFLKFLIQWNDFRKSATFVLTFLVFFILHLGFNFYESQKDEVLIHQYQKDKIVSVKIEENACFWIPEGTDRKKLEQYIINPYQYSRRINNVKVNFIPTCVHKVSFRGKSYDLK